MRIRCGQDTPVIRIIRMLRNICSRRVSCVGKTAQMMIMRITADREQAVSATVSWNSQLKHKVTTDAGRMIVEGECPSHVEPSYINSENPIVYEEEDAKRGIGFCSVIQVTATGGTVSEQGTGISVEDANGIEIRFAVRTSFNGFNKQPYLEGREYRKRVREDLKHFMSHYLQ